MPSAEGGAVASGMQTCTRLIRNVACDPRLVAQLAEKRTLTVLNDFVLSDSSFVTRLNCAVTLSQLSLQPDLLVRLVECGGIALAWTLLQASELAVTLRVATALLRITQHGEACGVLAKSTRSAVALCQTLVTSVKTEVKAAPDEVVTSEGLTRVEVVTRVAVATSLIVNNLSATVLSDAAADPAMLASPGPGAKKKVGLLPVTACIPPVSLPRSLRCLLPSLLPTFFPSFLHLSVAVGGFTRRALVPRRLLPARVAVGAGRCVGGSSRHVVAGQVRPARDRQLHCDAQRHGVQEVCDDARVVAVAAAGCRP
jgi:hypothetical protein